MSKGLDLGNLFDVEQVQMFDFISFVLHNLHSSKMKIPLRISIKQLILWHVLVLCSLVVKLFFSLSSNSISRIPVFWFFPGDSCSNLVVAMFLIHLHFLFVTGIQKGNKIYSNMSSQWNYQQDWRSCKTTWIWCSEKELQGVMSISYEVSLNKYYFAVLHCLPFLPFRWSWKT